MEDIVPGVDYNTCTTLIDDQILDSFGMLSLISEIEDVFGVETDPTEIIPENFNSAQSIWEMICRLMEE